MSNNDFLAERTEFWTRTLTPIPSVTGTDDEAAFAGKLLDLLKGSPAFADDPDSLWAVGVPGGAFPRASVCGLVRGNGRRTVILTGHFDIVETSGYGPLEPLALTPDELGPALIGAIEKEPFDKYTAKALDDLRSGKFIAARGLLDMKAGLAAGLAVAEAFAARPERDGNILFVAVPDEEGNSAGARRMAEVLADIASDRGLDIEAAINLDSTGDDGDGSIGRMVALGSVGKLLPSALVVGKAMHVADTFRGFGASALAGALAAEVEWLPDLTERTGEELGAGPTLLGMKDSKSVYDVTMPASVWMYWNVALHRNGPQQVLGAMKAAAERAAATHLAGLRERAAALDAGASFGPAEIVTYAELLESVTGADKDKADQIGWFAEGLAGSGLDLPEQCRRLTERLWAMSGRSGPAIVLGFASTPYLPVALGEDAGAWRLQKAVEEAIVSVGARFETSFRTIRYFPGISDVSYFGQADASTVPDIAANTPAWRAVLGGSERLAAAGIPTVNAGPWGRDYHTRLERMHIDYGFRVLPALVAEIADRVLAADR
jgi:arginine utilization protein RocB